MDIVTNNPIETDSSHMKYHCFDYDNNLLHMDTVIHMEKNIDDEWIPIDVSTSEFARVRNFPDYRLCENAFSEFRDEGTRGSDAFMIDTINAISKKEFGPSWFTFLDCIINSNIFSIVTARGHSPNTIRKVIEYIIDTELDSNQKYIMYVNCLKFAYMFHTTHQDYEKYPRLPKHKKFTDNDLIRDYLENCDYFGVSSPEFIERFSIGSASHPEVAKVEAIKYFANKVNNYGEMIGKGVKLGFSDDDKKTIVHITTMFSEELSVLYPIELTVFDTSDRELIGGKKIRI